MKLSDLRPAQGATHRRKRVGIGTGSGHGGTSCRGHKGQKSRSGGSVRRYFEGGQLPIHRRLPKVGFTPPNRVPNQIINVSDLAGFDAGSAVTPEDLEKNGLVRKASGPIKLLAKGTIEIGLTVHVDKSSEAARQKIEAAGGKVEGRV